MNQRLKEARIRKGLSQRALSDLIHVSRQAYSLYEKGFRHPGWDTMIALSRILGVSVDYLLGLTDSPVPPVSLDPREREVIRIYSQLDDRGRKIVDLALREESRYPLGPEDGPLQSG